MTVCLAVMAMTVFSVVKILSDSVRVDLISFSVIWVMTISMAVMKTAYLST